MENKMTKRFYSIFDEHGNCIGRWDGDIHHVFVYTKYRQAKKDAIALNIPNYQVGTAENALYYSVGSKLSQNS
jgi:hypothetical protein